MRTTLTFAAAAVLLGSALASAQPVPTIAPTAASTDIGVRFSQMQGDPARAQRYRDLGDGAALERARFDHEGKTWRFESAAEHIGREDQRFSAKFLAGSKVRMAFTWDQLPLYQSDSTRSPYSETSSGVFRLAPGMQEGIQNGRLTLGNVAGTSTRAELQSYRHLASFSFLYSPTRELGITLNVNDTQKHGTLPWMAAFAFSDVVELAAPVDTRTTDVDGGIEWSNARGMARVGYVGSWFHNNVSTLIWDNPLRAVDATVSNAYSTGLGGSQGQEASWPDNTQQGIVTSGSIVLPGRTRMTGSVTAEDWRQNQALLPVTINTAIPTVPLPRATADASARTLAMNYVVTSRPTNGLWLNARYRYYDFNNRTPIFQPNQFVVMDQTADPGEPTTPISYTRRNLDVDAALTPMPFFSWRVGYSRADNDLPTRLFKKTSEDTYRTSVDTSEVGIFSFRAIYEHSMRRGSEFDQQLLVELGEQPDLRHFDIANLNSDRVTGLVQVTPYKTLGLTASIATGRDEYPDSGFGLRDANTRTYSVGFELTPTKKIDATGSYMIERAAASQLSRNASPGVQQTDPTRNWGLDTGDRSQTYSGSVEVIHVLPRTDIRLGYDRTVSRSLYVFRLPADTTLAALVPLPPVSNDLQTGTADLRFTLTRHVALGAGYWYYGYTVDDFATDPSLLQNLALPGALYLGSLYRPSTAQTGSLRLIFVW